MNEKKIKVAILSDGISSGNKIFQKLNLIEEISVSLCLCNNLIEYKIVYILKTVVYLVLYLNRSERKGLLKAMKENRILLLLGGLKNDKSINQIKSKKFDIGIHDSSVIYKRNIINSFNRGILNCHIGLLPRYRGRCVMEWSLYENNPTGITVFYIDEGIDTGKEIVVREEVSVKECANIDEAKNKLFSLAPEFYAKAIKNEMLGLPHQINDGSGPRFYVMSNKLKKQVGKYFEK